MPIDMERAKRPSMGRAHNIQRIEIEPSTNAGFAVKCYYKPEAKKARGEDSGASPMAYMDPELKTFESLDSMQVWLKHAFRGSKPASHDDDGY